MSSHIRKKFLPCAVAVAALLGGPAAIAQQFKVQADKPSFEDFLSPEFQVPKQKRFTPKFWLEVETKLRVEAAESSTKFCDKLLIKWYVAYRDPDKGSGVRVLSKDVEHVNIPTGEDIYASIYLSPSSIKRLTGSDRASKGVVESVGYEILINGVKVAEESSKSQPGWWNSPKLSRSDLVPLLPKSQTPFSQMWWDRYAEEAPPSR